MKTILIHMKESALDSIKELGYDFIYSSNGEIDVYVPDVEYDPDHGIGDPDEQLCWHYNIDYDQVNCMELAWPELFVKARDKVQTLINSLAIKAAIVH